MRIKVILGRHDVAYVISCDQSLTTLATFAVGNPAKYLVPLADDSLVELFRFVHGSDHDRIFRRECVPSVE